MTVTQRKPQHLPDEIQTLNEPGVQYQCDSCKCDLTHNIRIKCADPICTPGEGVDLCPSCFCEGKEVGKHLRSHAYRVIEMNSYPIFTEDWGADEELLLLTGISTHGIGNWKKIAEHVGTRTKEEVHEHYRKVYVDSEQWPLPRMDLEFDIEPEVFHERKRRRITAMNNQEMPVHTSPPTSLPAIHEISTFLPGRLEFEHEIDNEAEDLVKDLEFGVVTDYGGDQIIEDENDIDVLARARLEKEKRLGIFTGYHNPPAHAGKAPPPANGMVNGHHVNGDIKKVKTEDISNGEDEIEEPVQPPPFETKDSLAFKLTLLEMYFQRIDKRLETKAVIFERGLLEYKKMQAVEKKRTREEREFLHRLRPFARLQTAEDYEAFSTDMLYEALLRKRIQELQAYRRLGLSTPADIDKYEVDLAKRTQTKVAPLRDYASDRLQYRNTGRQSSGPDPRRSSLVSYGESEDRKSRESTPRLGSAPGSSATAVRRPPAPLNLANSPSLHLLTPAEQTLCSQLRIQPKPYLVIKETLVREYARRGGKLRRREARDLVKIDVNKTSRVWDFLVQSGYLKITNEPSSAAATAPPMTPSVSQSQDNNPLQTPSANGSPQKDARAPISPRPPIPPAISSASSSQNGSLYSSSLQSIPQSWTTTT
ncbi:Transcriptional adapter 2 [Psilocybe cubensis]|uniref:Transcriptional adapter 2 n=2 Tax=Psilocybe cubensis TaxID=181762 RepID=A0A8H7Y7L1_PSICU|nr:Transcriptional adapter 2 [Psilocybe cubensis]KAH9484985.1 Transcriptional adapter 2 [Psilocybe cubensis]